MESSQNISVPEINDIIGDRLVQRFLLGVYIIVAVLGIVGNATVLYSLYKFRRKRHSITRLLIFNVTLCDLLNSLVCQPLRMADILQLDGGYLQITPMYCKWTVFLSAVFSLTGFHLLTAISLERYFLVCHPLKAKSIMTQRRMILATAFIWGVSFVSGFFWAFPFIRVADISVRGYKMSFCFFNVDVKEPINWFVFYHVITLLYYVIPVVIMTFAYTSVFIKLSQKGPVDDTQAMVMRTRKSLAKVMLAIALSFTILHTPHFVLHLFVTHKISMGKNRVFALIAAKLLLLVNSTLNPFLYCIYSRSCQGKKILDAVNSMEDKITKSINSSSRKLIRVVSSSSLKSTRETVICKDEQVICLERD